MLGVRSRPFDPECLRICLVSPYDFAVPGGVSAHVSNLAAIFSRRGHVVKILAPSSSAATSAETPGLVRMSKAIVPVRSNGSIARLTFSPTMQRAIKRELAEGGGFDVVHIHEPMAPVLPLQVLRLSNAVNVGTFHATRRTSTVYRAYKPLLARFHRRLDGKIAVSSAARDFVWRAFPGEYRIIPNGIDQEWFGERAEPIPELANGRPSIMFLGRLEKRKGLPALIDAMEIVRRIRPDARLVVVGAYDQNQLHRAQRRLRRIGIEDSLFTGRVSEVQKRAYLQSSDMLIAPAQGSARESQGINPDGGNGRRHSGDRFRHPWLPHGLARWVGGSLLRTRRQARAGPRNFAPPPTPRHRRTFPRGRPPAGWRLFLGSGGHSGDGLLLGVAPFAIAPTGWRIRDPHAIGLRRLMWQKAQSRFKGIMTGLARMWIELR